MMPGVEDPDRATRSSTTDPAMIFEVSSQGHRIDYVREILRVLGERTIGGPVILVLSPDFAGKIDDVLRLARRANEVSVIYLSEEETRRCQTKSGLLRRFYRHRILLSYIRSTGARIGFVNYLDTVMAGLALPFGFPRSTVGGILFRPTIHYPALGVEASSGLELRKRLKESLTRLYEDLVFRRLLNGRRDMAILSLDPYFSEFARARYRNGEKVTYLPEPYAVSSPIEECDGNNRGNGRVEFLMFGRITRRKGLLETLEDLGALPEAVASSIRLVVAGRVADDLGRTVNERVSELRAASPELQLEIIDRFITEEELGFLIARCDVVLAPYRRHVGSSGILAWAAAYNRPVISQRYGLMGALVERYGLGMTCDPEVPGSIAACIAHAVQGELESVVSESGMASFAAINNPDKFEQTVLDILEPS